MLSQIARAKHPDYVAAVAKANLLSDEAIASFSLNYRQETDAFKREEIKQKFGSSSFSYGGHPGC